MIGWLRRLWDARRVTVDDIEAGHAQVHTAADRLGGTFDRVDRDYVADAIRTAPCEPTRAPDHVARAKANRAAHYRAHGEDPDANWGPWVNPHDEEHR
jgi:hypothetical protein